MSSASQMEQLLEALEVNRENIIAAMELLADIVLEISKTELQNVTDMADISV